MVHEKHAFEIVHRADEVNQRVRSRKISGPSARQPFSKFVQMTNQLSTRQKVMEVLSANLNFLTMADCDMLLDLFGLLIAI